MWGGMGGLGQKLGKEDKYEKQWWGKSKAALAFPTPKPLPVLSGAGQALSTVITPRTAVNVHEAAL